MPLVRLDLLSYARNEQCYDYPWLSIIGKNEERAKMFHVKHFRLPFVGKSYTLDSIGGRNNPTKIRAKEKREEEL